MLWLGAQRGALGFDLFFAAERRWADLGRGLAVGLALFGLWLLAVRASALARALEEQIASRLGPLGRDEALGLAFLSALAEELFFRGAVQGSWGPLAATAAFALLHLGPGRPFLLWGLFAALAGAAFSGLVVASGALGGAVLAHFVVNSFNLLRLAARAGTRQEP